LRGAQGSPSPSSLDSYRSESASAASNIAIDNQFVSIDLKLSYHTGVLVFTSGIGILSVEVRTMFAVSMNGALK